MVSHQIRCGVRAGVNGTQRGWDGPPLVGTVDDLGIEPAFEDAGQAEQEGGDSRGAGKPARRHEARLRCQPAPANAARAVAGSPPVSAHIAAGDGDATSPQLPGLSAIRAADVGITAPVGCIR